MFLNERKIKILEAIINDYIHTGEPIGSRTIAKKYDLGISSATVRNEMSDLEELGLIVQPHASAGRVPSDKGYRYFVDSMMHYRELTEEEQAYLKNTIMHGINQVEYFMEEIAKSIALLTNYTTIVSEPLVSQTKVKHLQLVPVDETSIVVIIVTDSKAIKNSIVRLKEAPGHETLNSLSEMLDKSLSGMNFSDIEESVANHILQKHPNESHILVPVLTAVLNVIKAEDNVRVYTSGAKNILAFPEFSNLEKARSIFQTLEEKELLITLLGNERTDDIQIVIGSENTMEQMRDCSIIKANYRLGGSNCGQIGIIGPTRMDYPQVVSVLGAIVKNINQILNSLSGG